jgi:hypothetical protein
MMTLVPVFSGLLEPEGALFPVPLDCVTMKMTTLRFRLLKLRGSEVDGKGSSLFDC